MSVLSNPTEWAEGYRAFWRGLSWQDTPYESGPKWSAWDRGWTYAANQEAEEQRRRNESEPIDTPASSELSVAWSRGYLHYWHDNRPNEYEKGSIEYADWQVGFEDAAEEDYLDTIETEEELDD